MLKKHINQIKLVLRKLIKFDFYVKLSKCKFHVNNVNFLNFHVFFKGIEMLRDRIITIINWSFSEFHRNVQNFVNFANFYRRFIESFFRIIVALTNLLQKKNKKKFKIKFVFTEIVKIVMKHFQKILTKAFMLRHFLFFFLNFHWNEFFEICHFRHHISVVRKRKMTFYCFFFEKNDRFRTQLWCKKTKIFCHCRIVQKVASLCEKIKVFC